MGKKLDWNTTKKDLFAQARKAGGSYASMKDKIAKSTAELEQQEQIKADIAKMMPAMQELLKIRLSKGTPLTVMRPLRYEGSEFQYLIKGVDEFGYHSTRWVSEAERGHGEIQKSQIVDVVKQIRPGTKMVLKSLVPSMNQFIFTNIETGEEYEIDYSAQEQLLMQTDIYEVVKDYLSEK